MKLNIAYPVTGGQKIFDITDEHRVSQFVEKRMSQEVDGSVLGEDFKGYVFRISGGNDKQGFPMKQGILTPNRVRLMLKKGDKCFRERRSGERVRKSVRGCVVSREICVLNLIVVRKGPKEIEGVTDVRKPRRVGPKRAGKIRKLFGLTKSADVRKYVVRHKVVNKKGKEKSKAPKIQRLTTKLRLKRKKFLEQKKIKSAQRTHEGLAAYKKLLQSRQKAERQELLLAARLKKEKKLKKDEKGKTEAVKGGKVAAAGVKGKDKKKTATPAGKSTGATAKKTTTPAAPVKSVKATAKKTTSVTTPAKSTKATTKKTSSTVATKATTKKTSSTATPATGKKPKTSTTTTGTSGKKTATTTPTKSAGAKTTTPAPAKSTKTAAKKTTTTTPPAKSKADGKGKK